MPYIVVRTGSRCRVKKGGLLFFLDFSTVISVEIGGQNRNTPFRVGHHDVRLPRTLTVSRFHRYPN